MFFLNRFYSLFFLFCFFNFSSTAQSNQKTSSDTKQSSFKKWGYVYSNSFEKFSSSYIQKIQKNYDILCVTGLMFRGTGQLRFENEFLNKLDKAGIDLRSEKPLIYPMVTLSSIKDGIQLLTKQSSKLKSIQNLSNFLKKNGLKGVHLDFEGLPEDYSKELGSYLEDLKNELSKDDIKLTFAIFPQIEFSSVRLFHNPENIASNVDEVVLMSYDLHNMKTSPGCVSSPEWTKKNIEELLKYFSTEKIWLGIPAYGYEWSTKSKRVNVISAREAEILLSHYVYTRDENSCIKIQKKEKEKESIIYYSDRETRKQIFNSISHLNLAGTALWRLGLEED